MNIITKPIPLGTNDWTPGRGGNNIDFIVLHTTVGSSEAADHVFKSGARQASAHRIVDQDGSIIVEVSDGDTAWHAGNWPVNQRSLGLEHEDNGNYNDSVRTNELYASSAWQIADWCRRYNIPCKKVAVGANKMPVERGIVLHKEVTTIGGGTACPDGLDWERIIREAQAILGGAAPTPPSIDVANASTPPGFVSQNGAVKVINPVLRVHNSPDTSDAGNFANTPDGMLHTGNEFAYTGYIQGEDAYGDGRNVWLRTIWNHWVWAGGTDFEPKSIGKVAAPAPAPDPAPVPTPPQWVSSYKDDAQVRVIQVATIAHDLEGKGPDKPLAVGTTINQAGTFTSGGTEYARTQYGKDHGTWYGIPTAAFLAPPVAPETPAEAPAVETTAAAVETTGAPLVTDITGPTVVAQSNGKAVADANSATPAVAGKSHHIAGFFAAIYGFFLKLIRRNKKN